ncbi:hypothetical protein OG401_20995 [Kitasatospora purpeofusca]|uniref:hypothetical protein n=1 Tax=Kitasatospora purpeofusca TaxID=67352 RepID=UPI0022500043|nr:hypothetical protein [Kitasatospora purpeofusca]MCX4686758.1 hypothetical protein [Kitasatospora purpeofusca]
MPEIRVELELDGVWADVTADVRRTEPIEITRGRADEGSVIEPGRCPLVFDNRSGKYAPRNARGPLYGKLVRNTPVRVAVDVPGADSYLDLPRAGSSASTPDAAALDITGDLDVRIDATVVAGGDWADLVAKWRATVPLDLSWMLLLGPDRVLWLRWSETGSTVLQRASTLPVSLPPTGRIALRATLDVNDGGAHTVKFWTAASGAGPWVLLGDPVTAAGTTSIHAGAAPLTLGDNPLQSFAGLVGRVHTAEVRSGIGGTVVASPDFSTVAPGSTVFTDTAGRTWTLAGDAVVRPGRWGRFAGEISAWPPRRDLSGQDATVPVEAAGLKRRLGQGADLLASTLRRSVGASAAVAYWPMEDARGASSAFSPVPGVQPLTAVGLSFAAADGPPGSTALPRVSDGATLRGPIPQAPELAAGWQLEMVYYLPELAAPATFPDLMRVTSTGGLVTLWTVSVDADFMVVTGQDASGAFVVNAGAAPTDAAGGWSRLRLTVRQVGADVEAALEWFRIGAADFSGSITATPVTGDLGNLTTVDVQFEGRLGEMQLGHLSIMPAGAADAYGHADNGWEGDRASQRVERLCAEEGVRATGVGAVADQVALGPQQPATLVDLLEEAAEVDGGHLTEHRDYIALVYRPAHLMYNQAPSMVLSYTARGVAAPLEPTDDDQALRNDITVSRRGGSSARAVRTDGPLSVDRVGRYPDSPELNLYRDSQLEDVAGWRLHLGTWDDARYPVVTVDLAAAPDLVPAALATDVGSRIQLTDLPLDDGPGTADLIVQGYTETIGPGPVWRIAYTCTPAGPWSVAVTDDPDLGRADTDGATLAAGATATATTLSVATTGRLWSIDPADYPADLAVAGERITVTAMAGTSSPQTATVTRSANGVIKAQLSGADVRLWQPATLAL